MTNESRILLKAVIDSFYSEAYNKSLILCQYVLN